MTDSSKENKRTEMDFVTLKENLDALNINTEKEIIDMTIKRSFLSIVKNPKSGSPSKQE